MHLHLAEPVSHCLHKVHWHRGHDPPILTHNTSLENWPCVLAGQPDRFVEKVECCIAHTSKRDAHGVAVDKHHEHSFVRITLTPIEGEPETVIFVERAIDHAGHSVIPLINSLPEPSASATDTPSFQDHACTVLDGDHSEFTHKPKIDRSIVFETCKDRRLSLHELAIVFQFISRNGTMSEGEDCVAHSMWFARTCLAALKTVMLGAHHCITPPRGEAAIKADCICQRAIDNFINHTFKTAYHITEVVEENRIRQLDALCGEEKEVRKLAIERYRRDEYNRDTTRKGVREILKTRYGR